MTEMVSTGHSQAVTTDGRIVEFGHDLCTGALVSDLERGERFLVGLDRGEQLPLLHPVSDAEYLAYLDARTDDDLHDEDDEVVEGATPGSGWEFTGMLDTGTWRQQVACRTCDERMWWKDSDGHLECEACCS